ncbi:MAG: cytochrome c peroxidase [Verrucomicrobiota bacterium]|jgi:cytochrome c peroxidase
MRRVAGAIAAILASQIPAPLQAQDGVIDLAALANYANQGQPIYIRKDNTTAGNQISNAGATLGRVLFYDKRLSRNNSISCSSCHQQANGFGDRALASSGVAGTTGRHAMRLANAKFGTEPHFFWDERAATLENQTTQPIQNAIEMGFSGAGGDPSFADLIAKLSAIPEYPVLFNLAFGSPAIDETKIQNALAQFVRSIQSFDSKYDAGRAATGDAQPFPNFTASENNGKQLFLGAPAQGGANCAVCHRPPEFDIDPNSRNNGVIAAIGGGQDLTNTRSPSLRNLTGPTGLLNGPLMHNGNFTSIAQVINHYAAIPTDNANLDPRLRRPGGGGQILNLTPQQRLDLEAFLLTISGTAVYTDQRWSNPFSAAGTITLLNAPATPTPPPAQSVNISTRLGVGTGDGAMIGGFIIRGNSPKPVVIRGLGPTISSTGLTGLLEDPVLELRGANGAVILKNDNWRDDQRSQIEGTVFQPGDDRESVIIASLAPAAYTAILTGKNQSSGLGLIEIYDRDPAANSELANISTRGLVGSENNVLIGGFILGGNAPQPGNTRVAIRGLGPSLSQFGLSNLLEDPTLELHDANGAILIANDNWTDDSTSAGLLSANGLALADQKEAAIFTSLPSGQFTAILSGKNGSAGIGLIEIYNLR